MTNTPPFPAVWSCSKKGAACVKCPKNHETPCVLSGRFAPHARITFVVQAPTSMDIERKVLFKAEEMSAVLSMLRDICGDTADSVYNAIYLTGAPCDMSEKPSKEVITACAPYLQVKMASARAYYDTVQTGEPEKHVIIPLGATATTALLPGVKSLKEARGRLHTIKIKGEDWTVLPTFSPRQLYYNPGYAKVMREDIVNALKHAYGTLEDRSAINPVDMYTFPDTIEEVAAVCDEIIEYYDQAKANHTKDSWPISVDIETTSLKSYAPEMKIISIGFGWDDGKATCILLDHNKVPYDASVAWEHVKRVLSCPKPKIFHNARFDIQVLENRFGVKVENLWWDTMLGEHFLDEDKKGEYSLKVLTVNYLPKYADYESSVKNHLATQDEDRLAKMREDAMEASESVGFSWDVASYFDLVQYESASAAAEDLDETLRLGLHDLEKAYLLAVIKNDDKAKASLRSKIRARCKKYDLECPNGAVISVSMDKGNKNYEALPLQALRPYNAVDADVTRQITKLQLRAAAAARDRAPTLLADMQSVMKNLYIKASRCLARMEYTGTPVDNEYLDTSINTAKGLSEVALDKMKRLICDPEFNPNSAEQLAHVAERVLDFPKESLLRTELGEVSITKEWIAAMIEKMDGSVEAEFLYYLLLYRNTSKVNSTVFNTFKKLSEVDGRIHTTFGLNGTATGRLSSSSPNLQNIQAHAARIKAPSNVKALTEGIAVKRAFRSVDSSKVFFQMDIGAAEVRVLCAYAPDPGLIKAMSDPTMDIHSFIASEIFNIDYVDFVARKDIDPDIKLKRSATKRVVFGIVYGAGAKKIAEQVFDGLDTDPDKAAEQVAYAAGIIEMVMGRFPLINNYIEATHGEVARDGYVRTLFGRYRRFPLANVNRKLQSRSQRMAVNFKIQSTASDIVLSQLCDVEEDLHRLGGQVLLTVHDSIAGLIPKSSVGQLREFFDHHIVDMVRQKFTWLPVPFTYDLEVGPTYGDLIPYAVIERGLSAVKERDRDKISKLIVQAGLEDYVPDYNKKTEGIDNE